jgi:diguanylate cyclase (GGDEF)-like protein
MINRLSKIFRFNLNDLLPNGKRLIGDFRIIDQVLDLDPDQLENDQQLADLLVESIKNISSQIFLPITLYVSTDQKNWGMEFLKSWNRTLLSQNITSLFTKEVVLNTAESLLQKKSDDKTAFISFHLNHKYFFILEIINSKWSPVYARFLYIRLLNLFDTFQHVREKNQFQDELKKIKQDLLRTQKELQIAEKAVKRKVYDLHNLVEASNDIYSILNFRQLINSALLTVIGQVGVQSAFVLMYDQSKRSYSQIFHKGFKSKEIQKLAFKIDSPLVKYFTKHSTPVYVQQLAQQDEFKSYVKKLEDVGIFIVAPITFADRVQGVIATREKHYGSEFTQTDFELFHVLVNIISISIENAQHYEEIRNLSLTDEMTKLHNYRSFISRLKEEVNRAKRNQSHVSLVILDIDHFKNYNDTLGHQAGDEALREVGKVLRKTVRDEDIVSRYGGEEFCVIFPGIAKEDMEHLGDRIRQRIEAHKFYKEKVQPIGQLTVSLGGATYPDDASDIHDLIQKADEALYRAKHLGRNQMQLYNTPD